MKLSIFISFLLVGFVFVACNNDDKKLGKWQVESNGDSTMKVGKVVVRKLAKKTADNMIQRYRSSRVDIFEQEDPTGALDKSTLLAEYSRTTIDVIYRLLKEGDRIFLVSGAYIADGRTNAGHEFSENTPTLVIRILSSQGLESYYTADVNQELCPDPIPCP